MSAGFSGGSRQILIAGNGAAGFSAAKAARAQDPDAEITMFCAENRLPYYRLRLCDYIGKNIDYDKLKLNSEEWFEKNRIRVELGAKVTAIHPGKKKIAASGREYHYDSLILATGSTPIMPPFKGKELKGIHTVWTVEDIAGINESLQGAKKAVVIGGGLLRLEAAYKISETGIGVSLIEAMPRLLPKQLDEDGSEVFRNKVESLGISVLCGKSVEGFEGDIKGHVKSVRMTDSTRLEADIVIVAVGVAPNTDLCRNCGIIMDRFVEVNEKMETNIKDIYAAGDVASVNGKWFGQWAVAGKQGQVAGTNAAGGNAIYKAADVPYVLATMGTRVVCSGDTGIARSGNSVADYKTERKIDKKAFSYSKLIFRNGLFVGFMLVGEPAKAFNKLQAMLMTEVSAEAVNNILHN
jgi:nitrite reductase (NADH) large subunit